MINNNDTQWTLMFFFASDNTLSPSTLSQLKAIKAAGPHAKTKVIVYFDPNEKGAPTRVFEINKDDKGGATPPRTSESEAPLVSVLTRDNVSPADIQNSPGVESQKFAHSLKEVDKLKADTALSEFLGYCREAYPAKHYMLFLVGHGLVVGRDAFLPDDNPDSAIGLERLGEILLKFSTDIGKKDQKLELIGMHSCSMSAVEVAYELKDTASYMLASQGISFVGSWPYRQMLTSIYEAIDGGEDGNVVKLMKKLQTLCIHYSVDFIYAGYSADICLCSLDSKRVDKLTKPLTTLAEALKHGLQDERCRELILLAHWRAQSYWQETYTDIYDFCLCLRRLCSKPEREKPDEQQPKQKQFVKRDYDEKRHAIIEACTRVISTLAPTNGKQATGPVECVDFIGPDCQYSHGLSIYFPWSQPLADENDHVLKNYQNYTFTEALPDVTWLDFLKSYFTETERENRLAEDRRYKDEEWKYQNDPAYIKALEIASATYQAATVGFGGSDVIPTGVLEGKVSPPDAGGGGCTCASTKNYSRELSMSEGVSRVFGVPRSTSAGAP